MGMTAPAVLASFVRLLAIIWLCWMSVAVAATRVALVSSGGNGDAVKVVDLAETRLSADGSVALLDRCSVQRVVDEQKLSLSGLVNASHAVTVGRLLPVDLFAVVEADAEQKQIVGCVVFDARTGVRLWDAALSASGMEASADAIVAAVRAAQRKHGLQRKDLHALCLLPVRNADLPRELDSLCDSVELLLGRSLIASPHVAVLERQRLEHVTRQRSLPITEDFKALRATLVLVELEIGRAEGGRGMRGQVTLSSAAGGSLGNPWT